MTAQPKLVVHSNSLRVLADEIKVEHREVEAAEGKGLEHAIAAGGKLTEARQLVKKAGIKWGKWVEENCGFAIRTAQAYMRVAKKRNGVAHLSFRGALKAIAAPQEEPPAPASKPKTIDHPIRLPPNYTSAEELCRDGLAMEAEGLKKDVIFGRLKIGKQSYKRMREIVLLKDRATDLSAIDREAVNAAFATMTEKLLIKTAYDSIAYVGAKVWGPGKARRDNQHIEERIEVFEGALDAVATACSSATELVMPYLTPEMAKAKISLLERARNDLSKLNSRLRRFVQ